MIKSLQLSNYRSFEDYELNGLSRVNLIVGQNNSGKTSILEALQILGASKPGSLLRIIDTIARNRGEVYLIDNEEEPERPRAAASVRHFFNSHVIRPQSELQLTAHASSSVKLRVGEVLIEGREEFSTNYAGEYGIFAASAAFGPLLLSLVSDDGLLLHRPRRFGVMSSNSDIDSSMNQKTAVDRSNSPVFIRSKSLSAIQMVDPWNRIVVEGREREVYRSMSILDPEITSIVHLSSGSGSSYRLASDFFIGRKGLAGRIPLGTQGEGIQRLLALSIGLIEAEGSILLVDEIDTGLHYSVHAEMWRLVVETAVQSNVQVFATTHSYDCLKGLAQLYLDRPDLAECVALTKLDRRVPKSISFEGHELPGVIDESIEVR